MGNADSEMRGTAVPRPARGYVLEELDDELVLFEPDSGRVVQANVTAALVWGLCDGRRSVAEIADLLAAAYPGQEAGVRADVPRIVAELAVLGALEIGA